MVEILLYSLITALFVVFGAALFHFHKINQFQWQLIRELHDRVMSGGLPEFRLYHPVNPPVQPTKPPPDKSKAKQWVKDPFAEEKTKIPDSTLGGMY
jgi:hypothetical protein